MLDAKKNYLTFQEQKLYTVLKDTNTSFSTNDVSELYPEYKKSRIDELLSSLNKKNKINKLDSDNLKKKKFFKNV